MAKISARGATEICKITATLGGHPYLVALASDGRVLIRAREPGETYRVLGHIKTPGRRTRQVLEAVITRRGFTIA